MPSTEKTDQELSANKALKYYKDLVFLTVAAVLIFASLVFRMEETHRKQITDFYSQMNQNTNQMNKMLEVTMDRMNKLSSSGSPRSEE